MENGFGTRRNGGAQRVGGRSGKKKKTKFAKLKNSLCGDGPAIWNEQKTAAAHNNKKKKREQENFANEIAVGCVVVQSFLPLLAGVDGARMFLCMWLWLYEHLYIRSAIVSHETKNMEKFVIMGWKEALELGATE